MHDLGIRVLHPFGKGLPIVRDVLLPYGGKMEWEREEILVGLHFIPGGGARGEIGHIGGIRMA